MPRNRGTPTLCSFGGIFKQPLKQVPSCKDTPIGPHAFPKGSHLHDCFVTLKWLPLASQELAPKPTISTTMGSNDLLQGRPDGTWSLKFTT